MRAYSCARISFAIAVAIAACVAGALVNPQEAMAREPDYKAVISNEGGGTSGGGEWRTDRPENSSGLPLEERGGPRTGGAGYAARQVDPVEASWVERVEAAIVRMVRFVGDAFSQLF